MLLRNGEGRLACPSRVVLPDRHIEGFRGRTGLAPLLSDWARLLTLESSGLLVNWTSIEFSSFQEQIPGFSERVGPMMLGSFP